MFFLPRLESSVARAVPRGDVMGAPRSIVAVDVGSTTTKAVLVTGGPQGYALSARAEAPTTVEQPEEDVMIGVRQALRQLERAAGRRLLAGDRLITPQRAGEGADFFAVASSAGGGLQMLVTGLMKALTAESAERAALGAGAVVVDVICLDDGRPVLERIRRIRDFRPDIILLAGGTDEGNPSHVVGLAEYVAAARPVPRRGGPRRVPVIYAGNRRAREYVQRLLDGVVDLSIVDNLRPRMEKEHLEPVRAEIHRLFLEHVMAHAPGYGELIEWAGGQIRPTPAAVGRVIQALAQRYGVNVVAFDIGGATTDVFSVFDGAFHRSVGANLGMSYSLGNVFMTARADGISRWLPFAVDEFSLRNWSYNKVIRPWTLPETVAELLLEQAVGREALRLSFAHHKKVAAGLRGVSTRPTFDTALLDRRTGETLIDPGRIDVLAGGGGLLSHAPRPAQALLMLLDAVEPHGLSRVYLDRLGVFPHLGVVAEAYPDIAEEVLRRQALLPLGTCLGLAARGRPGAPVAEVDLRWPGGRQERRRLRLGDLEVVPLQRDERVELAVRPRGGVDAGAGPGRPVAAEVAGGEVGLVLDARGRPLALHRDAVRRRAQVAGWLAAVGAYEPDQLRAVSLEEGAS